MIDLNIQWAGEEDTGIYWAVRQDGPHEVRHWLFNR